MKTNELMALIESLKASGYGHIDLTHEGTHLVLDKNSGQSVVAAPLASVPVQVDMAAPAVEAVVSPVDEGDCVTIDSPIVGTFYESPSPEAGPYIKVGDTVKKGDIVCIIEAMKLMNEIEAEVGGVVVEILAQNEGPVEYGQALYKIKQN